MDSNVNEPSKVICWRDDQLATQSFIKESNNDFSKESVIRESIRRRALGDKKNIPIDEDKKNRAEVKTHIIEKSSSSQRLNNPQVFCESASNESMLMGRMGDIRMNSETAEKQFERVDPDAPIEHFNCSNESEGYEEFWLDSSRALHSDEILRSVYTMMGTQSPVEKMDLLEEEVLEDDIFETPTNNK